VTPLLILSSSSIYPFKNISTNFDLQILFYFPKSLKYALFLINKLLIKPIRRLVPFHVFTIRFVLLSSLDIVDLLLSLNFCFTFLTLVVEIADVAVVFVGVGS
jgi:hypothetical protein